MSRCEKKRKFRSEAEAREASEQQMNKHHKFLRIYKCDVCHRWHITHQVSRLQRIFDL